MKCPEQANPWRKGRGGGEVTATKHGLALWDSEKVLSLDSGGGYTTP